MNWEKKLDAMHEAKTDKMIDEIYKEESMECSWCEDYYPESQMINCDDYQELYFCCDQCLFDFLYANEE